MPLLTTRKESRLSTPGIPEKSYLKSRRKQFREAQRGKILNFLDRNVDNNCNECQDSNHEALSECHSSAGKHHYPSVASTVESLPSQLSIPESEEPSIFLARRPSIVNLFRRNCRSGRSNSQNALNKPSSLSDIRLADTEQGCERGAAPRKSNSTTTTPIDFGLVQQKYVVNQVLKCYPKDTCKTFEDHREFALSELTQHANALCMTAPMLADVRVLLERMLEESIQLHKKLDLDEHDEMDESGRFLGVRRSHSMTSPRPSRRSSMCSTASCATRTPKACSAAAFHEDILVEETQRTRNTSCTLLENSSRRVRTPGICISPRPPVPDPSVNRPSSLPRHDSDHSIEAGRPLSSATLGTISPRPTKSIYPSFPIRDRTVAMNSYNQDAIYLEEVSDAKLLDTSGHPGTYTGTISKKSGKPHGQGRIVYLSPDKDHCISYDGEWNQGQWNGQGTLVRNNGDLYKGSFCDDQIHGHGEYSHHDSRRVFRGRFVMGHRIEGTMKYSDGSVYEGSWYCGKRQGVGIYRFSDGSRFKGEFVDDRMSGYGQLVWPDGSRYVGEFHKGCRHGKGKEYDEHGCVRYDGLWRKNVPVVDQQGVGVS